MFQCQGFQFTSVHSSRVTDPYVDFGFKLVRLDLSAPVPRILIMLKRA